ncbi:MAG: SusC/RagA family TonB-linked outer membrane protein, partial [Marivirga sp.]|nr:SusC/RagA family TonB-linked outer membrane protein [Marivirga sp.]
PLAAMQGRVAGLEVTQLTGVPGGNFTVRIRGQNSIANGNDPLYIIDGVPYTSTPMSSNYTSQNIYFEGTSPLNNINPGDIESIEVLKDADATAIYGSRGSNGVILITTKKGSPGRTQVSANYYSGLGKVSSKIDLLNTEQYVEMRNEAFQNDGQVPNASNAPDLTTWEQNRYTDWQKELLGGTAHYNDAQVSVSGGSDQLQFIAGGGYRKETTVFPGDNDFQRISGHLNLTNTSRDGRFKSSFTVNYTNSHTDFVARDLTREAMTLPPNAPALYKDNGELNWDNSTGYSQSLLHPLAYLKRRFDSQTNNLMANAALSYEVLPGLEILANMGYTQVNTNSITKIPKSSFSPALSQTLPNESIFSTNDFKNWMIEPQVKWNKQVSDHRINVLAGATFLEQTSDALAMAGTGFVTEALMDNLRAASNIYIYSDVYSQYRYHAIFGRINYQFKDRYILNVTGRRDGSSRFGPGNQFANFGAIGGAWLFSKEEFMTSLPFLSTGKLRASYGSSGNDQLGDYQYLDTYSSSGKYYDVQGLRPVRLSNADFAWESNKKLEAALELGMLKDRITVEFCYYNNRASNQLVGFALPPTTGFTNVQGNLPAVVENAGVELQLHTTNVDAKEFTWTTSLNLSVPRNTLIEFPNLESSPDYANTLVVGEPLNIRKRYTYSGIHPQTGLYTVEDLNGDGFFSLDDRTILQFIGRNFYGGIGNTFEYKGLRLDVLFQYVDQTAPNYISSWIIPPGFAMNQPAYVLDRWQREGDLASVQKFTTSSSGFIALNNYGNTENAATDASFLRLKNISLSYSLPDNLLKKINIQTLRVYVQGQNLFTLTEYRGLDPETGNLFLPPLKIITGGIQITL